MESTHIKYELSFEEYQNLIEQFNNLVKTKDFKPLYYKDYRKIAGKHLKGLVSKVIIEFIDGSHFTITFYPTKETIYTGNIFDLSFGTFINYFNFEEVPKEVMKKNNTYDIWGNGINNSINNTGSTSDQITTSCPDYARTNQISVDSNSYDILTYDTVTKPWYVEETSISKIDNIEEKVRINGVKVKEDMDCIQDRLDSLTKKVDKIQQVSDMLERRISELEEEQEECNERKDNEKTMNTNKMFNFDFGFVDSNIRMSPYGMAVRNADGRYVSYDIKTGSVIDVEPFNFEGHRLMMKMPVAIKDVAVGDIVIHNHKPMFVVSTGDKITAIDIYNGEEKTILLTKNMFGFDFVVKVISFINFSGASAENPFGNMWPLFMLSDRNTELGLNGTNEMDSKSMFMLMAIMGQMSGSPANLFQNPMFLFAFLNDSDSGNGNMKDFLMFMALTSAMNANAQPSITTPPAVNSTTPPAVNSTTPNTYPSSTC